MQSSADNVDAYLVEVPEGRRATLDRLRSMCVATLSGYEECMDYGMPSYRRPGGDIEVAFASQARYISIYILRSEVLDRFRDRLAAASLGKGCVRYTRPEKIDFAVIDEMLRASSTADGPIC